MELPQMAAAVSAVPCNHSSPPPCFPNSHRISPSLRSPSIGREARWNLSSAAAVALVAGGAAALTMAASAQALALDSSTMALAAFQEPPNALSLPTWAIHVSSVVEWVTAMALVWEYAEKSGFRTWKGLAWGMVPLLGGAFCACTWHFFYNSESLEILVALQSALTVIGNITMCFAAYRIYKSSQEGSRSS